MKKMVMQNGLAVARVAAMAVIVMSCGIHEACAQSVPVRVAVGAFFPTGNARDVTSQVEPDGEIEVGIPNWLGGNLSASLGYSENLTGSDKLRMVPLTLNYRVQPSTPASGVTGGPYLEFGAGPYFVHVNDVDTGNSGNKTTLGGFGAIGYNFPHSKMFVEGKYSVAGRVAGVTPQGVALLVGYSF